MEQLVAMPLRGILRSSPLAVEIAHDALSLRGRKSSQTVHRSTILRLEAIQWFFWDMLEVHLEVDPVGRAPRPPLRIRGLPRGSAIRLVQAWEALGIAGVVQASTASFRALLERDEYFAHSELLQWQQSYGRLHPQIPDITDLPLPEDLKADFADCGRFLTDAEAIVASHNDEYVARKKREHSEWFSKAGGTYGLSDEQQEAILRDEDNCLVVAGAGTGKTSTVVGKIAYLLHTGAAIASQVLVLSFTRKSAEELERRISDLVGQEVKACTFHSLGLDIIAHADEKKPSLTKLADDTQALRRVLAKYVEALFSDPATSADATQFFAFYLSPYRSLFDYTTLHEYSQYVKNQDFRTLQGEKVKSHEELTIANWLFVNGVEYEYERKYIHDVATIQHRQYRPDFYLPASDVYLEHFGIDKYGNTAPFVDQKSYRDGMRWKRAIHRKYGTRLVVTYSYERMEGRLLKVLEERLTAAGVELAPRTPDEILARVRKKQLVQPVARLLSTFLLLFKENAWTPDHLASTAACSTGDPDSGRIAVFLRLFARIHALYEADLRGRGEIDFADMIGMATRHVRTGRYRSSFRHIIVDEFQDLSRGRGQLLKALLAQVDGRRLFCVGDDWQSIYRFTGSDIGQMIGFESEFGHSHRCDLTQTYRFPRESLEASSRFIQRNQAQLRKRLTADHAHGSPAIVLRGDTQEHLITQFNQILKKIANQSSQPKKVTDVLILARYNHTLEGYQKAVLPGPCLNLHWMTVHRAKGLEADAVVILDVTNGRLGFPCGIVDDPLLDLVLAAGGGFPNAEERRLFYVALTRSRGRTFILTDVARQSCFVDELQDQAYAGLVQPLRGSIGGTAPCPACRGGALLSRGKHPGRFWGCSNYPVCRATARGCPYCEKAPLARLGFEFRCASPACGKRTPLCPSCHVGALVPRTGPHGDFYGCSEWKPDGGKASCTFTRPILE